MVKITKSDGEFLTVTEELSRKTLISVLRSIADEYDTHPKLVCNNLDAAMTAAGYSEQGGQMQNVQGWSKKGKKNIYLFFERGSSCYVSIN